MADFAHLPATIRIGDLEVRRLGFGAMQLPGPMVWGESPDPARARAVLKRTQDLGIQFIDTSWYYGPLVANRYIAEALRRGCDEDLRGLKLERVDVVHLRLIHGSEVPFEESLDAMIDLKKEGKIRHLGLSNVTLAQLEAALGRTPIVTVQNLYNVAAGEKKLGSFRHAEVKGQETLVDFCAARAIAFLPFFPLAMPGPKPLPAPALEAVARRRKATPAQVAIAWLLARSPAILPIPGTSSPEHLDENWAARSLELSADDLRTISQSR
jgi:pyridoxine 4-dehydrogenase